MRAVTVQLLTFLLFFKVVLVGRGLFVFLYLSNLILNGLTIAMLLRRNE